MTKNHARIPAECGEKDGTCVCWMARGHEEAHRCDVCDKRWEPLFKFDHPVSA